MAQTEFQEIILHSFPDYGYGTLRATERQQKRRKSIRNFVMGAILATTAVTGFAVGKGNVANDRQNLARLDNQLEDVRNNYDINNQLLDNELKSLDDECLLAVSPYIASFPQLGTPGPQVEAEMVADGLCVDETPGFVDSLGNKRHALDVQSFYITDLELQRNAQAKDLNTDWELPGTVVFGVLIGGLACCGVSIVADYRR